MQTVDIVNLVENNPITRLSNTYNNCLLSKIKEHFTNEEQQLFITSFYCYLNCNNEDFVVDLDNVWKWLDFTYKDTAKRALEKNFTINKDYKVFAPQSCGAKKDGRGGHNKETILLTLPTFKEFCILAGTEKAKQIRRYFVKLEELLHKTLEEECIEMKEQLEQKNKQIEEQNTKLKKTKKEKELLREKTILEQFPKNTECVYYGLIDDTNEAKEKLVKFGQSNDLNKRVKDHKKLFTNFRLVNAFKVDNKQRIENGIKAHPLLNKFRRTIIVKNINQTEILAINELTITELCRNIHNVIYSNEFTTENFMKILEEQRILKIENILIKEENEKIKNY